MVVLSRFALLIPKAGWAIAALAMVIAALGNLIKPTGREPLARQFPFFGE